MSEPVVEQAQPGSADTGGGEGSQDKSRSSGRFSRSRRSKDAPAPDSTQEGSGAKARSKTQRAAKASAGVVSGVPANRREIPATAFDFLGGAYASAVKARRAMYAILAILALIAGYLVVGTFSARSEAEAAQARVEQIRLEQSRALESLGQVEGVSVDQRLVIARQLELSDSLVRVAASQPSLRNLMETLRSVEVPGVAISEVRLGALAASGGSAPAGGFDAGKGVPLTVLATAVDLFSSATWADQVRSLPGIIDVNIAQSGTSVTLTAYVPIGEPPPGMLTRLLSLGVPYVRPERPVSPSIPDAAPSASPAVGGATP